MSPDSSDPRDGKTVAKVAANEKLEHSVDGVTTRSDRLDAGVPMKPGDASEPVGPEDALGPGKKRGDYRERVPGSPHTSEPIAGAGTVTRYVDRETGAAAKEGDKGAVAVVVDNEPNAQLVAQKPRTEEIGDVAGKKGGVDTVAAAAE